MLKHYRTYHKRKDNSYGKRKSVIERIFDENDNDPVVLYSNDKAI